VVNPVPSHPAITTPFGRRGRHWSCRRDAAGNGIHTGADWGSPGVNGAPIVAARGGTVRHVNFGSAFGPHQFVVEPGDGTRDFYAHTTSRPADGARVATGARVAAVGALGNVTGPHLHFERHTRTGCGWSCDVVTDPTPSVNFQEGTWFDMATEADLRRIVRAEIERAVPTIAHRVNGVLGDFNAEGQPRENTQNPERANVRIRRIWNRVSG
jgi:murein DD-endopeptidase MepM/ murein hydrolase activator NlpD